jgi:hypothetical protein
MAASYVVVAVMGPATMPTWNFNGLMTSERTASISADDPQETLFTCQPCQFQFLPAPTCCIAI